MDNTRNRLTDLNDYLFMELERLDDESLTSDQIRAECVRAKAVADIGDKIIKNAQLVLDAVKLKNDYDGPEQLPRLLEAT